MKTLVESIFDKDLVSNELPIEKAVKKLDDQSLYYMSGEEVLDALKTIVNDLPHYSVKEIKQNPVDLSTNVLIVIRKNLKIFNPIDEVSKYVFIFNFANARIVFTSLASGWSSTRVFWDHPTTFPKQNLNWKPFISYLDRYYGDVEFIVLNKSISEELINRIYS